MKSKNITITNPVGLHTRLAALFVDMAKQFKSNIKLQKSEIYCDAKEFLKILKMGITEGSTVTLWCEGEDEDEALAALSNYLENLELQQIQLLKFSESPKTK